MFKYNPLFSSLSLQVIFFSEQPFYGNYSTLGSHTNTIISHTLAYSSRWRRKPWQGLLPLFYLTVLKLKFSKAWNPESKTVRDYLTWDISVMKTNFYCKNAPHVWVSDVSRHSPSLQSPHARKTGTRSAKYLSYTKEKELIIILYYYYYHLTRIYVPTRELTAARPSG